MDNLQADMQKMMKDVKTLLSRKLPVAAGKFAKQHFQDNFWPPAKRLSSRGTSQRCRKRGLTNFIQSDPFFLKAGQEKIVNHMILSAL